MDLIVSNNTPLTGEEYKILSFSYDEQFEKRFKEYDWKYQAYLAYQRQNELKNIWKYMPRDQKVKESHAFYDKIFRCKTINKCNFEVKEIHDKIIHESCKDHPFNARTVMRIIMEDWPDFMNNFEDYKIEFRRFIEVIKITKQQNQDVKVKSDKKGGILMYQTTQERYHNMIFINRQTKETILGFPLEIPEWYNRGESKRLIK
jgi:hypothetical protein